MLPVLYLEQDLGVNMKSKYEIIIEQYPELNERDFDPIFGKIEIRDDSDGFGDYIARWDYEEAMPKGLVLGKK